MNLPTVTVTTFDTMPFPMVSPGVAHMGLPDGTYALVPVETMREIMEVLAFVGSDVLTPKEER